MDRRERAGGQGEKLTVFRAFAFGLLLAATPVLAQQPPNSAAAMADRDAAIDLLIKGYRKEAVEPYLRAVRGMTEVAYGCGRRERRGADVIVWGCDYDENTLANFLLGMSQVLIELDRSDEARKEWETVLARFEPRWAGCESEAWGTDCKRAHQLRREFRGAYARFLIAAGDKTRGVAIYKENLEAQLPAALACPPGRCDDISYSQLFDFSRYRAALADSGDRAGALALDELWLPMFVRAETFTKGAAPDAGYSDKGNREFVTDMLKAYVADATAAGETARATRFLDPLGQAGLVTAQVETVDFDAAFAALEKERRNTGGSNEKNVAVARKIAALHERKTGPDSIEYADALNRIANAVIYTAEKDEAEPLFTRALAITRKTAGDGNWRTHYALAYLSSHLTRLGKIDAAIAILTEVLAHPENDAMPFYADPLKRASLSYGSDPFDRLNQLKAELAGLLLDAGRDTPLALASVGQTVTGMKARRDATGFNRLAEKSFEFETSDPFDYNSERRYYDPFVLYADALWANSGGKTAMDAEAAFVALQEATMGTASRAIARTAAERAAKRGAVAPLLAERKKLDDEIEATEQRRSNLLGPDVKIPEPERQKQLRELQDAVSRADDRRNQIDATVRETAPDYFALIRPQALTLKEMQALLEPDEAMLLVVPSKRGVHSLLVTANGIGWHRAALKQPELDQHVRRLLWDVGASVEVSEEENRRWSAEGEGALPFDRGTAHRLYMELIEPLAASLAGKTHLFIAASGSLSSLPFGILVTKPPVGADGDPEILRTTAWFADEVALLQLPSPQSLRLLRLVDTGDPGSAAQKLLGFGNPVLTGDSVVRGSGAGRQREALRNTPVSQVIMSQVGEGAALANPEQLRAMASLPGTAIELAAMKKLFDPGRARIVLGANATETAFKRSDLSSLSVLALATHGLVAGELGLAEPGLVFTPPVTATALDDGLLAASEVAALAIDADWVILSACNTASGDGSTGSPGLSGLARAFFFAGARSLLASHWPVKDAVAARMTVRAIELKRDNAGMSRAQALQQAMREVRDEPDDILPDGTSENWAHPSSWGPFTLIGDGT